jgi:hypothetical protein
LKCFFAKWRTVACQSETNGAFVSWLAAAQITAERQIAAKRFIKADLYIVPLSHLNHGEHLLA